MQRKAKSHRTPPCWRCSLLGLSLARLVALSTFRLLCIHLSLAMARLVPPPHTLTHTRTHTHTHMHLPCRRRRYIAACRYVPHAIACSSHPMPPLAQFPTFSCNFYRCLLTPRRPTACRYTPRPYARRGLPQADAARLGPLPVLVKLTSNCGHDTVMITIAQRGGANDSHGRRAERKNGDIPGGGYFC